ncbi:GlxA family transcriptional regulator [Bradyrhizobium sp. PUT101]|uniref:GlxA family transcriptional regulator n=1 Tax=Bradyrhizobium sp. PUT101 TaxID=3447427 RepID=UPI003F8314A1
MSIPVFAECDPSIIYGVFDTLWSAGRIWDGVKGGTPEGLFEPRLVGAAPGPITLITGVSILPQDVADHVESTDIVFVPNVIVATETGTAVLDRRLIAWIRQMHEAGAQMYGSCGGSLVLAEAGLLDGYEATTHWVYEPVFRKHFPKIKLRMERVLVQNGPGHNLVCGGGASSWQDLALLIVAKYGGTEEAIRISKLFLYQWHREGQLPFASMVQNVDHGDGVIRRCQDYIAQNYQRQDLIASLVHHSGLPKRSFDRRFRAATGYSPLAYVQTLRIEEAKQLLETTETGIEDICREVGYEDVASFRRLFRKQAGVSPKDYRRKFQLPDYVTGSRPPTSGKPVRPRRADG